MFLVIWNIFVYWDNFLNIYLFRYNIGVFLWILVLIKGFVILDYFLVYILLLSGVDIVFF